MKRADANQCIQNAIARLVVEKVACQKFTNGCTTVGPLTTNYFSFGFYIAVHTSQISQRFFVKIPKEDLRKERKLILPLSAADRCMAEEELKSLRTLADQWHSDDLDISWVRLRHFFPRYNAIVTDAVEGEEALVVFRRLDLRCHSGLKWGRFRLRGAMGRLGQSLARFHQKDAHNTVFRLHEVMPKLERYCHEIDSMVKCRWPKRLLEGLKSKAMLKFEALEVSTLKGIDIRNVMMNERDRLFLLDPGRLKRTCPEADLARFIMTYRILYWGSLLFFLGLRPDFQAEKAFVDAYYSHAPSPNRKLLSLYLVKEQLKHWHTAIDSLQLRSWPMPLKRLIAATYVNPFYIRQLSSEIKLVNSYG